MTLKLYEFRCKECLKKYVFKDRDIEVECCSQPLSRIYAVGGISFKGSGFYRNDSKK